ncbi:MAG: hypothetical protein ACJ79O_05435, partial [Myxococcales bacterium]
MRSGGCPLLRGPGETARRPVAALGSALSSLVQRGAGLLDSLPVKGLLVGWAATKALDGVSTYLYENEDVRTRISENIVRRNRHAYERAVEQMAELAGKSLSRRQRKTYGWRFHKAFG